MLLLSKMTLEATWAIKKVTIVSFWIYVRIFCQGSSSSIVPSPQPTPPHKTFKPNTDKPLLLISFYVFIYLISRNQGLLCARHFLNDGIHWWENQKVISSHETSISSDKKLRQNEQTQKIIEIEKYDIWARIYLPLLPTVLPLQRRLPESKCFQMCT